MIEIVAILTTFVVSLYAQISYLFGAYINGPLAIWEGYRGRTIWIILLYFTYLKSIPIVGMYAPVNESSAYLIEERANQRIRE